MSGAKYYQTSIQVTAKANKNEYLLKTTGSTQIFDGWTKLFANNQDKILPELENGQSLNYEDINPKQKFTQPPPRYNDASLIKELEKRGIGRPSTYASIITVIVLRGYVERKDKRFWATSVGSTVNDFLVKHFSQLMDYDFTANLEEDLDEISLGKKEWQKVLARFYKPFISTVEQVTQDADRVQIPVESTGEICPDCGKKEKGEIVIRTGKFGKFKSCNRFPECKYTQNLVEKVEGMKCLLCQEGDVVVKNTRWGKSFFGCSRYPKCDWASWKKPEPGEKVSQKEWEEIKEKRAAKSAKRKATMAKNRPSKSKKKKSPRKSSKK